MADNPIRHEDIIQPGNPFDEIIRGLKELINLLKATGKEAAKAKDVLKIVEKINPATKEGKKDLESAARATQKLTAEERERLRVLKQLERELAKANLLKDKDYQATIKQAQAAKIANRETEKTSRAQAEGARSTNTWSKALGSFAFKFNSLGNIAANVVSRLTQAFKKMAVESLSLAARAEGIERAFARLNKPELLAELKKATRNTVSELELMQRAVVASRFDISLEALPRLLEFATKFAQDAGVSVDVLTDKIVRGIGRKSLLILDDLGLTATQVKDALGGISVEAATVAQITEAVGKIAKKSLEDLGGVIDTTATDIENLKAEWADFKAEFGSGFAKALRFLGSMQVEGNLVMLEQLNEALRITAAIFRDEEFTFKENSFFNTGTIGDFKKSGLWAMTEAIGEMDKTASPKLTKIKRIIDDILDPLPNLDGFTMDMFKGDVSDDSMTQNLINRNREIAANEIKEKRKSWDEQRALATKAYENGKIDRLAYQNILTNIDEAAAAERDRIIAASFNLANRITTTFTNIFAAQKEKELSMVGDNAEKRAEIEKKYARREQIISIAKAIIDGASSIQKTKAQLGLPAAIPFMIADAALTAIQIGVIANQKFAEGGSGLLGDTGGMLQGRSHAMGGVNLGEIGEAERGEYFGIVNRQMARKYAGDLPMIFDSLNNGAFHEVWGRNRSRSSGDPYTKKIYEVLKDTPQMGPLKDRIEKYPGGRTRIVNS